MNGPTLDPRLGNPEWSDNWTIGPGVRFELLETATGKVFLCQDAVTEEELAAFERPDGFTQALVGEARADLAYFARSPRSAEDGPLETIELGGRRFGFVARPAGMKALDSGATDMTIDKHHSVLFRAGRTIDVLDFGDGTVAIPAWGSPDPDVSLTDTTLAPGWALRRIQLVDDLVAVVPHPSQVIVLDKRFGFHGPIPGNIVDDAATVTQEISSS